MHPHPVEMENSDAAASPPRRRSSIRGFDKLKAKGVRRQLSKEELEKRREDQEVIAAVAMAYMTVVILGFIVALVYLIHGDPPLLVWSAGLFLCLLFYIWSHYINQFLLETYSVDLSILVLLLSLSMLPMSLAAGVISGKCAAMAIVCLDVLLGAGYLGSRVASYMRTTPSSSQDKRGANG